LPPAESLFVLKCFVVAAQAFPRVACDVRLPPGRRTVERIQCSCDYIATKRNWSFSCSSFLLFRTEPFDVEPPSRKPGKPVGCGRGECDAGPPASSWACAQVRPSKLERQVRTTGRVKTLSAAHAIAWRTGGVAHLLKQLSVHRRKYEMISVADVTLRTDCRWRLPAKGQSRTASFGLNQRQIGYDPTLLSFGSCSIESRGVIRWHSDQHAY
jgi:hypothetical protein